MSAPSEENGVVSPPASSSDPPEVQQVEADGPTVEFLSNIDEATWKWLAFPDSLTVTSLTGKEIGSMKITVEEGVWRSQPCYLVHANSDGIVDQVQIGTSVTAYVSRSLGTLEQTHHEYVKIPENPLDKKTFLSLEEDKYVVCKTVSQGEERKKTERDYSLEQFNGFISEGSNLLLQRLLVRSERTEPLSFISFDSEANLCRATYKLLERVTQTIATQEVSVIGVERTLQSTEEPPSTWHSYYLPSGNLASRSQIGSQVQMKLMALPEEEKKVLNDNDKNSDEAVTVTPLKWEEDMELYSRFLDRKAELADDHATYMRKHPELRALIADFLQFVLLRKPDDVCEFAADFFSAFSAGSVSGPSFARSSSRASP